MTTFAVLTRHDNYLKMERTFGFGGYAAATMTDQAIKRAPNCDAAPFVMEQIGWAFAQFVPCHDSPAPDWYMPDYRGVAQELTYP